MQWQKKFWPCLCFVSVLLFIICSCSIQKKLDRSARSLRSDPALEAAYVGISIYEPATRKYWYNFQADHYFVPASNTKIPTCYAALKYLGDSLPGLKYGYAETNDSKNIFLAIQPTGDPTFLHSDFNRQPVWDFLTGASAEFKQRTAVLDTAWHDERWGQGWSWNDYQEPYMAERNSFPIFGNIVRARFTTREDQTHEAAPGVNVFRTQAHYFDSVINRPVTIDERLFNATGTDSSANFHISLDRKIETNEFSFTYSPGKPAGIEIPFVTRGNAVALDILSEKLGFNFRYLEKSNDSSSFTCYCGEPQLQQITVNKWNVIHSQPTDSVLRLMMHRSDNFFAEQSLLMVSNQVLGIMNDERIIDTLLKTDFRDLPQKPVWVDGSGLSRYDLFSPEDFVFILNKIKNEFGLDRIKNILPTGNEGTLSHYYKQENGYLFAKTGSLSGVATISGFLYTRKNKLLIFSILVNNHTGGSAAVRKAVEKFVEGIRDQY